MSGILTVIDFNYIFDSFSLKFRRGMADLDCGFKRTCDYISKNLQLEHMTLCYCDVWNRKSHSDTAHKNYVPINYVSIIDNPSWVQHLLPLVETLKTFTVMARGDMELGMARALQTYLESKLPKTSKTLCQSQSYKQKPIPAPIAWQQSHLLEL